MFKLKITIDTKEDSHEEIQKVIKMLSSLVEGKEVMSNQVDMFGSSSDTNQSSDIFGDDSSSSQDSSSPSKSPDGSGDSSGGGIFNMFGDDSGSGTNSGSDTTSENTAEETKDKEENEDITIDTPEVEEYH